MSDLYRPYVVFFDVENTRHDPGWTKVINRWHIWKPHRGKGHRPMLYCQWTAHSDRRTRRNIHDAIPWCERCRERFLVWLTKQ